MPSATPESANPASTISTAAAIGWAMRTSRFHERKCQASNAHTASAPTSA